ncbi:MAG: cytochrome c4 [Chromatiales bacterium]|nr:cytochrome c4 [Chromatiales bacterium]
MSLIKFLIPATRPAGRHLLAALLLSALPFTATAAGSIEAGQAKSAPCAACHGPDGNSVNPDWPSLAGQHASYLIDTLRAYQDGRRDNVLMTSQAMALSEQDILDLAAFYAAQQPAPLAADPELASRGERLYRGGNLETGVAACIACHGPTGRGNAPAVYPIVAGQHAAYAAEQLRLYRSGQRTSDPQQMMRNIAALMTDEEILAVSSFMQGLR